MMSNDLFNTQILDAPPTHILPFEILMQLGLSLPVLFRLNLTYDSNVPLNGISSSYGSMNNQFRLTLLSAPESKTILLYTSRETVILCSDRS